MSPNQAGTSPNIILIGHGNIGTALAQQLRQVQGKTVFAVFGNSGGILIPNDGVYNDFFDATRDRKRGQLNTNLRLNNLVESLGKENVVIVDASSNPDPNIHSELFEKGFRIVSANKNPVGLGNTDIAMKMLNSPHYGAEPTVMAGQGVLDFIGAERLDPNSTGPIESITQIDLIGSGTLSGIAEELARGIDYSEAVKNAIKRGDTEPNPNDDMDGMDLAKKLVILARKTGYNVSISHVRFGDGFLGTSFRTDFAGQDWGDKDNETEAQKGFIEKIRKEKDAYMKNLIAEKKPNVPRYVGRMIRKDDGTVDLSVGIEFVSPDSEHCAAKYNKTIITVNRGGGSPIDTRTISGRGAGPIQTAQGIIKDINQVLGNQSNS